MGTPAKIPINIHKLTNLNQKIKINYKENQKINRILPRDSFDKAPVSSLSLLPPAKTSISCPHNLWSHTPHHLLLPRPRPENLSFLRSEKPPFLPPLPKENLPPPPPPPNPLCTFSCKGGNAVTTSNFTLAAFS